MNEAARHDGGRDEADRVNGLRGAAWLDRGRLAVIVGPGALTAVTSSIVAVSESAFSQLLVLLPGETHAPGTATGKTGTPAATAGGRPTR